MAKQNSCAWHCQVGVDSPPPTFFARNTPSFFMDLGGRGEITGHRSGFVCIVKALPRQKGRTKLDGLRCCCCYAFEERVPTKSCYLLHRLPWEKSPQTDPPTDFLLLSKTPVCGYILQHAAERQQQQRQCQRRGGGGGKYLKYKRDLQTRE